MRKFISVAIVLMLVIFAAGCSAVKKDQKQTTGQGEDNQAAEISQEIDGVEEDSGDLSSAGVDNVDKDLEDFSW